MNANAALQIILQEMGKASSCGYRGIAFGDPESRHTIFVYHVSSSCTLSAQSGKLHRQMWPDLMLVFNLLDCVFTQAGYPRMIKRGLMMKLMFAGDDSPPNGQIFVEQCALRVAEVIGLLEQPLENPVL